MRKILFLFTFFAVAGLFGPASKEAAAQCTHLGLLGACPLGVVIGSTSVSFNANGTINWPGGVVSGACCAEPSGTGTGAGLLDLNNELGRAPFRFGPIIDSSDPGASRLPAGGTDVTLTGENFQDFGRVNCDIGGCDGGGLLGDVFGANPNSGYLCDSGGGGCGSDQWVGLPQPGFGDCGPGGCTGAAPIQPLNFGALIGSGRYSQNLTQGEVDPFGGISSFQDPITGQAIDLPENEAEWPEHVKHADKLNSAYVNDEIPYPFDDPNWRDKSVEDFANEPPPGLDNTSRPDTPFGTAGLYTAVTPEFAPRSADTGLINGRPNSQIVEEGDTLFTIARRLGLSVESLAAENNMSPDAGVTPGTELQIPSEGADTASSPRRDTNWADKVGAFGVGGDTLLGGRNFPRTGSQVARNFGIQTIINYTRVDINTENPNADLTNYVSTVVTAIDASRRPKDFVSVLPVVTPTPAPKPAENGTEEAPEPQSTSTNLRIGGWQSLTGIDRVDTEGQATVFRVTTTDGRTLDFKSRDDAFLFSNRLNRAGSGTTYNEVVGELPSDRGPINVGPVNTDAVDALTENIPDEFRAPKVNDMRIGEFLIKDPRTGREIEVKSAAERDTVLNAMRKGATLEEAAEIAQNAPVVTPDGLASATSSRTPKTTQSTPAPAGSTPTFTDNRPAIIVQPTRPEGTSAGTMKGLLNGNAYDIEVIKTPDGRILAVGTGENAGHVFGEVKETSNKLFGDFRREGPWTPPPAKTTAAATTPGTQAPAPRTTPPSQAANNRVRSQIANSDRDYLLKTGGFAPGDALNWTSTKP